MRPVRLDINGFASFRDRAVIDFTDADFFALVGPTGSGKSTVLDAITFALYGTAPRWGRTNAVADALAPTSNRCTVSLIFDVGSDRYQVAREVRRSGHSIGTKSVSLVKLEDSTVIDIDPDGPQPEVLCGEARDLTSVVEDLLGLEYEHFCQCVVLPQGEFAKFLTAKASERQKILLKLLGADQYEGIGKQAGAIAAQSSNEVEILTEQLGRHADATPEAQAIAQARATALGELVATVDGVVPAAAAAHSQVQAATERSTQAQAEITRLRAVQVPDGVAELQKDARHAEETAATARDTADRAAQALTDATEAAAQGPQRATLTVIEERYTNRTSLAGRKDPVTAHAQTAQHAAARAEQETTAAREVVTAARAEHARARARREQAGLARDAVALRIGLLASVRTPDGIADLAARATAQIDQQEQAGADAVTARAAHAAAAAALSAAPTVDRIGTIDAELTAFEAAAGQLATASDDLAAARVACAAGEQEAAAARSLADQTAAALDEARAAAGASQLRGTLEVGHACPVCEQTVTTLPAPSTDATLDGARATHQAAVAAAERTQAAADAAQQRASEANQAVEMLTFRRDQAHERLTALLPGQPAGPDRGPDQDRALLADLTAERGRLVDAEAQARAAAEAADLRARQVTEAASALSAELTQARSNVHQLLGTLTELAPPPVDAADLGGAWATLETWSAAKSTEEAAALATTDTEVAQSDQAHDAAERALDSAEETERTAHGVHNEAVRDASVAIQERDGLLARLDELDHLLVDAPPADALPGLLIEADRLAAAVNAAAAAVQQSRSAATAAETEAQQWRSQVSVARSELAAARDSVAALEPPAPVEDLAASWEALAGWAAAAARSRTDAAAEADAEASDATRRLQDLLDELDAALHSHDVDTAGLPDGAERAAAAKTTAAVAAERARGEADAVARRLADAESVRTKIDDARSRHQVASELAGLLRSNRFPQWLADAALDTLVAGASESLRRLSGDQYDLTHRKGEFFVVDHSDADSERSVRTLSGGETFQASLALALALSDHLAGMGGSTKLESIFLDEGFGTLDPDALEMVASTLESLAQGDRMVGVITHVSALAERIPVRFNVRHDSRTSAIEPDRE